MDAHIFIYKWMHTYLHIRMVYEGDGLKEMHIMPTLIPMSGVFIPVSVGNHPKSPHSALATGTHDHMVRQE